MENYSLADLTGVYDFIEKRIEEAEAQNTMDIVGALEEKRIRVKNEIYDRIYNI